MGPRTNVPRRRTRGRHGAVKVPDRSDGGGLGATGVSPVPLLIRILHSPSGKTLRVAPCAPKRPVSRGPLWYSQNEPSLLQNGERDLDEYIEVDAGQRGVSASGLHAQRRSLRSSNRRRQRRFVSAVDRLPRRRRVAGVAGQSTPATVAHRIAEAQGDVALLVGMAGRSHWSLSVELRRIGVGIRRGVSKFCSSRKCLAAATRPG